MISRSLSFLVCEVGPGWALGTRVFCVSQSVPWAILIAVFPGADSVEPGRNLKARESQPAGTTLQRHMDKQTHHWLQESGHPLVALALELPSWVARDTLHFIPGPWFVFRMTEVDRSALYNFSWSTPGGCRRAPEMGQQILQALRGGGVLIHSSCVVSFGLRLNGTPSLDLSQTAMKRTHAARSLSALPQVRSLLLVECGYLILFGNGVSVFPEPLCVHSSHASVLCAGTEVP